MKIATMLRDIWQALWSKAATENYPAEAIEVSERFRGKLRWNPDLCTGCRLCVQDCPANAIDVIVLDKKSKRFVMDYHADRCVYCGQCVENCRFDALQLVDGEWELASTNPQSFEIQYGSPENIAEAREGGAKEEE